jgi:hypothetical protein
MRSFGKNLCIAVHATEPKSNPIASFLVIDRNTKKKPRLAESNKRKEMRNEIPQTSIAGSRNNYLQGGPFPLKLTALGPTPFPGSLESLIASLIRWP